MLTGLTSEPIMIMEYISHHTVHNEDEANYRGLRADYLLAVNDGKETEDVYNSCSFPQGPYTSNHKRREVF